MTFLRSKLSKNNLRDLVAVQSKILSFNYDQNAKSEREFELALGNALAMDKTLPHVVTQSDRRSPVVSAQCFGKKHRPDMAIGEGHIALELKYLKSATTGFRDAIGQACLYRLCYRFVVVVVVLGPDLRHVYADIAGDGETQLKDVLGWLASEMKSFVYVAPAFRTKKRPRVLAFHTLAGR